MSEITGIYNENESSYIFGEDRQYNKESDGKRVLIQNNENKIDKFLNGNILATTSAFDNVFILKKDGEVYKLGKSYDDLQMVSGGTNIAKIGGYYAIDNDNNIWKLKRNADDTYFYEKCDYVLEGKVNKIETAYNNQNAPIVLYETGKVIIMNQKDSGKVLSNQAIDIAKNENKIYVLEYNNVIVCNNVEGDEYPRDIDMSRLIDKGEISFKINNQGTILTNKGNCYYPHEYTTDGGAHIQLEYKAEPEITNVKKLGNYTYQSKNNYIYYMKDVEAENSAKTETKIVQANKLVNDIVITKDESTLAKDKVIIKVQVPNNKYTIKLPNGNIVTDANTTYEVKENGVYTFEFTDKQGYTSIRVIHITNIQSRKATKVPEATVVNGKIKLEGDENIEYSLDGGENWNKYSDIIDYSRPIYARVKNSEYECSIIKITLNNDGKLEVENTESRKIQGEILTGATGRTQDTIFNDKVKVINFAKDVAEKTATTPTEGKKGFFQYISDIADNIIYSFSSTDGRLAGCYFKDDITEVTYKDINNNIISIQDDNINTDELIKNDNYIDYAIIANQYKTVSYSSIKDLNEVTDDVIEKLAAEEEAKTEKSNDRVEVALKALKYAYVDNKGNLESNVDIINKAKSIIGADTKYAKVVGDGVTFYLLTQTGEVYIITEDGNGTYNYFDDKFTLPETYSRQIPEKKYVDIVYKLDVNNIVDIYDSCTGLTKDGKVISLINDNEEDTSAVQELQNQTDKYLVASHLGLKDGKLYNFENVKEGVEVSAGKIVKSDVAEVGGVYSETQNTIKMFSKSYEKEAITPELKEGESFIGIEKINEELPKFVDIAEYRDEYLTRMGYTSARRDTGYYSNFTYNYEKPDKYAMVYALTDEGEIWTYINGYIVDTGINIDYFGPTSNYSLSNTEMTKNNINLNISANTTNNIITATVKRGSEEIAQLNKENFKNNKVEISKNGNYEIQMTDGKGRSYKNIVKVKNIDKLAPYTPEIQKDKLQIIFKGDREATDEYAQSGINERLISYDGTKWTKVDEEKYKIEMTSDTVTIYAKTIDKAGNESEIAKAIINKEEEKETGRVIVKYQDVNGEKIHDDTIIAGEVGKDYKVDKNEIDGYELVEVVGNEKGKYTKEDQVVIYKYEKVKEKETGRVIAKYQDINGNTLKDDTITTGYIGENYKQERTDIDIYELVEVVGNEEGKYTKEDQVIVYKYKRIKGRIIIIYEDPNGEKIRDDDVITGEVGKDYKVNRNEIDGYEIIEVIGNEEGKYKVEDQYVRFKYKKIENPVIPQTGQNRILYVIMVMIIIACIGTIMYIKTIQDTKK